MQRLAHVGIGREPEKRGERASAVEGRVLDEPGEGPVIEKREFLVEAGLSTGEGKLYQEVELPRRPYSDVESEMANQLSILPNYQAWCRLINIPTNGEPPRLIERKIMTDVLGAGETDSEIARYVRQRSRMMAKPREEVEKQITQRMVSFSASRNNPASSQEKISN